MKFSFLDTLLNMVSGLGGSQDKSIYNQYALNPLSPAQLMDAYRGDWIARKAVNIPAQDATREWRIWQAEKEQITALENSEKQFRLIQKTREAIFKSRLFGGAGFIIGVDGTGKWEEPLNLEAVKKGALKYIHVFDRYEVSTQNLNKDLLSPFYGEPTFYTITSGSTGSVNVHPSRVVKFVNGKLPSRTLESDPWGDSIIQSIDNAVKNAGVAMQGVAALIEEACVDVVRIPDFMANVSTQEYKDRILERFQLAKMAQSLVRMKMLDKEEEWDKQQINFANLPEIIRVYLQIVAGASDVPATRFLGQSPSGLNATGDSDIRNYYDSVADLQKNDIGPSMNILDEVLIRSSLGVRPSEIYYNWLPLWQPTPQEKADINLKNSQSIVNIYNTGLVPDAALAEGAQNMLIESGMLPGLESALDDLPDEIDEKDPEIRSQFTPETA